MSSSSDVRARARVLRAGRFEPAAMIRDLSAPRPAVDAAQMAEAAEQGYQAGFEEGRAAGLAAGLAERDQIVAARRAELTQVLDGLDGAATALAERERQVTAELEAAATRLAFEIAEAVIGREVALAANPGIDAVNRALALAPDAPEVTVRLHPDDAAGVEGWTGRAVTVVPDPAIERGGCLLDAGAARVDARISSALARVRAALEL
jgi:flagellar assembly protein FliH